MAENFLLFGVFEVVSEQSGVAKLYGGNWKTGPFLLFGSSVSECLMLYGRTDLKKNIFAVCDLDVSYACNLTDYLNEKRTTPFEVQAFTNVESLQDFAKEHEIELLLISTRAMCNEVREIAVGRIVILSEGEQLQELNLDEYPFVYKYQSSDQLICEVMEYYTEGNPHARVFPSVTKTKLVGIYSPTARSGKTSFALALGEILAETKQVLYLNLEEYSGFEELFDIHYRTDLTDLIYFSRQKEDNLVYKLNSVIQSFHGLQYVPPAFCSADLRDVTGEEWLAFLREILQYCEYDVILLDLGGQVDGLFQILQKCDRVYMPVQEDLAAAAKLLQYEKQLRMLEQGEVLERTKKIQVPSQVLVRGDGDITQQLVWGEMGNFVRKLLWEEENG